MASSDEHETSDVISVRSTSADRLSIGQRRSLTLLWPTYTDDHSWYSYVQEAVSRWGAIGPFLASENLQ
jgi:hypothetical protein